MPGFSTGGACYASIDLAARAVCEAYGSQMDASGRVARCEGAWGVQYDPDPEFPEWTMPGYGAVTVHRYDETGAHIAEFSQSLAFAPCEYTAGVEYWTPVLGAFLVALVTLLCARVIPRIFNRETY